MFLLHRLRISSKSKAKLDRNPEEGLNEDEDVQMEKARVKEALTCQSCEEVSDVVCSCWSHKPLTDRQTESGLNVGLMCLIRLETCGGG